MANIAANNYKDRKILKRHKNFMPDRLSVRRPNKTGRIEFHTGQRPMSDTYFKPWYAASKKLFLPQVPLYGKINCNLIFGRLQP